MNKLPVDLHTHTIASGHAFSTMKEMAESAAQKGLKMIAVTDHGIRMPGGPHEYYFYKLLDLPAYIHGVEVLKGVEANIIDANGALDMSPQILDRLDIVLAGFHAGTGYESGSVEENTRALVAAISNPKVHLITHPGNPDYPVDIEKIVKAAKIAGKAIEINNSSLLKSRPGSSLRCMEFVRRAKNTGVLLAVNSDAHNWFEIGETAKAREIVENMGIKPAQILNSSAEAVHEYLRRTALNLRRSS